MAGSTVRRFVIATFAAILTACSGGDGPSTPAGFGAVAGRIVAADGTTPIPGAEVGLATRPSNGPIDTTDANGEYTLTNVPAGRQTLMAERGVFRAQFQVTVRADETVNAAAAEVAPVGKLAYVPGSYDAIEHIVRDSLEFPMTELTGAQLGTPSVLNQFAMIFVNCGADVWDVMYDETALANLKAWVHAGGVLYASDLQLDLVEAMFPDHILSRLSGEPQDLTATVTSPAIASFIGKSSATLRYDLGGWATPDALSSTPQVLLRGTFTSYDATYTDKPLAILIPYGEGKVVFTSFHNEAGVTLDQLAVLRYFVFVE